ncbi:DUF2303 family protein [Carnimonas bestiolae]|uniref:DUF2303 family protein n=1 Tax=Carnimonas bestiolae TaxID=3402172 RepID=UPI003EDBAB47
MTEYKDVLESTLAGRHVDTNQDALLVPDGFHIEDLEGYGSGPRRISSAIDLIEVGSFIQYVNDYRATNNGTKTIIKADVKTQQFTAILDYHRDADKAGWCKHRAVYNCPQSRQWQQWSGKNCSKMNQATFAEFIENNQLDIDRHNDEGPTAADMLEVSRNLSSTQKVEFKSSINLANGDVEFQYQQNSEGVSGSAKGTIEVPKEFWVIIPVYEGDAAYPIKARLRYRISDGVLALWYELVEPEKILEDAFRHMLEQIDENVDDSVSIYRARA